MDAVACPSKGNVAAVVMHIQDVEPCDGHRVGCDLVALHNVEPHRVFLELLQVVQAETSSYFATEGRGGEPDKLGVVG